MINQRNIIGVVIGFWAVVLLVQPAQAHERDRGRGKHYRPYYVSHRYPAYGEIAIRLPHGVISVVIGGKRYHYCEGVFYRKHARNYVVVAPPPEIIVRTERGHGDDAQDIQDIFTVHIPNARGGYTPVTLKRSGNGFVGPQGEFYPEFPKVGQLKVMYAKAE